MLTWINKKRNKKGFTLVELVVVIAILGILAAIAVPKFGSSRESAKIATHNANVRILKSAAMMYIVDNPDTEGDVDVKGYLDGDAYPTPPTGVTSITETEYVVTIGNDGNVSVTPGELP